eukprot:3047770-Alexandrium_andersonii.AAC.1
MARTPRGPPEPRPRLAPARRGSLRGEFASVVVEVHLSAEVDLAGALLVRLEGDRAGGSQGVTSP